MKIEVSRFRHNGNYGSGKPNSFSIVLTDENGKIIKYGWRYNPSTALKEPMDGFDYSNETAKEIYGKIASMITDAKYDQESSSVIYPTSNVKVSNVLGTKSGNNIYLRTNFTNNSGSNLGYFRFMIDPEGNVTDSGTYECFFVGAARFPEPEMPLTIDLGQVNLDPTWQDIADKPFTSLGQGLVVNNGILTIDESKLGGGGKPILLAHVIGVSNSSDWGIANELRGIFHGSSTGDAFMVVMTITNARQETYTLPMTYKSSSVVKFGDSFGAKVSVNMMNGTVSVEGSTNGVVIPANTMADVSIHAIPLPSSSGSFPTI